MGFLAYVDQSTCLCLPSATIKGVCQHALLSSLVFDSESYSITQTGLKFMAVLLLPEYWDYRHVTVPGETILFHFYPKNLGPHHARQPLYL